MFETYLCEKTICSRPRGRGGWPPVVVFSLLCWAFLPVGVKTSPVMTNGITQSPQNVTASAKHEYYRCMYCHKAEHIIDCLGVITCAPHEVCYIEKEMLPTGWPVINAGCRSRHTCNLKTCFGESMHGYSNTINKRSTLSCHHCCEGEFCNLYGCPDSEDMAVLPSSRCLACDAVKDPALCDKLINCPYSQQCVSYGVFHAGGLRFELGCEESSYCNAFKNNSNIKRDVIHHAGEIDLASKCCDTHLCNRNWPPQDQPPPRIISGFTCHHQTLRPLLSTVIGLSSTSPTVATGRPHSTYSPPDISIPTSENCKDRATESNCNQLNITNHLCDTISLTSVYYCVKFCGFCNPNPTVAHTTSTIPVSGSRPSSPSTSVTPSTQTTIVSSTSTLQPSHSPSTAVPATSSPGPTSTVAHTTSAIPVSGSRPSSPSTSVTPSTQTTTVSTTSSSAPMTQKTTVAPSHPPRTDGLATSSPGPSTSVKHPTQRTTVSSTSSSAPVTQKTTLEPSHSPSTAVPATSSPYINIPAAENCTDRADQDACVYLNTSNQLCANITQTSVFYCAKYCGFCTPLPTIPGQQGSITLTAGPATPPAPQSTASVPLNVPVLVGKRQSDDSDYNTNQRNRHPVSRQ